MGIAPRRRADGCRDLLPTPRTAVDERFASNSKRLANSEALRATLRDVFANFTATQLLARLDEAGIANAKLNDMRDVWEHPQLAARERWTEVETAAGRIPALLPPGMPASFEPRMDPIPALGQHTAPILVELGYSSAQIDTLRDARAV